MLEDPDGAARDAESLESDDLRLLGEEDEEEHEHLDDEALILCRLETSDAVL